MFPLIWKDLLLEARRRDTVPSLFVLGVLILTVFIFTVDDTPSATARIAPALLWVAIVFSSTLGLSRIFISERESGGMTGLLMAPVDRSSIYLGKLCVNFVLLVVFEAMILPIFGLFFGIDVLANLPALAGVLMGGSLGIAATGTLFALVALGTRARELMLPLLVVPLQIPLIMASVRATEMALAGQGITELGAWGSLLFGFDVLFVTLGWLTFEFVSVD